MQGSNNIEQHRLLALARGDREATEQIYRENYHIVSGWLVKHGGAAGDVADLFQEAMVVLFGKAQDEQFRLTCSIGTYLFAICKHLWYKRLQKQNKSPEVFVDSLGTDEDRLTGTTYEDDISVHAEREAHYEQLDAALDELGEPCRSLLRSFYYQDKSMQEIAADFGYTNPDNAKTQKYKCLTRLKKLFYARQG